MDDYYNKYLKYKNKYINLKNNLEENPDKNNLEEDPNKNNLEGGADNYKYNNIKYVSETSDKLNFEVKNKDIVVLKNIDKNVLDNYMDNERISFMMNKENPFFAKPYEIQSCEDFGVNKNTKSFCQIKKNIMMDNTPTKKIYFLEMDHNRNINIIEYFINFFDKDLKNGISHDTQKKMLQYIDNFIKLLYKIENILDTAFQKKGFINNNLTYTSIVIDDEWTPYMVEYNGSHVNNKYKNMPNFIGKYFVSLIQPIYYKNEFTKKYKNGTNFSNLDAILSLFIDNIKIQYIKKSIEDRKYIDFSSL